MGDVSVLAILNQSNNYKQQITLSSPIDYDFVKFLCNREILIKCSFLNSSYIFDANSSSINNISGLALAGGKLSYEVKDKGFYQATIELNTIPTVSDNIQIICYFYS